MDRQTRLLLPWFQMYLHPKKESCRMHMDIIHQKLATLLELLKITI